MTIGEGIMAQFLPGYLYQSSPNYNYGIKRNTQPLNKPASGEPIINWSCKTVSKTFATFIDDTSTVQRRRIYRDALGSYVFQFGKFPGAPVLRAEYTLGPDKFHGQ